MGSITALQVNAKRNRVNVFIEGSPSFTVGQEVATRTGLKVGQDLSTDQIEELMREDLFQSCLRTALHYLGYRPRSEAEVRQRLRRRGFNDDVVERIIVGLKEQKLIDDAAFAQYWRDNRLSFKPRSRKLIKLELRQKGVTVETANQVLEHLNDEAIAYEAGLKRARVLVGLDYGEFHRRLSHYLQRRGFNYEVISSVVARLWQEQ